MPQPILKLIAIAVSLGWLGLIVELVRRGRLREDHALLWLLTGVVLLLFSLFEGALRFIADLIGVVYAPSILFGVGMMFAVVILLFQGITLSRLQTQNKELAQEIALLTWEVQQLRRQALALDEPERVGNAAAAPDQFSPINPATAAGRGELTSLL